MIADLNQPARCWIADVIQNFGILIDQGAEPSMTLEVNSIEIELRLKTVPGLYKEVTLQLVQHDEDADEGATP